MTQVFTIEGVDPLKRSWRYVGILGKNIMSRFWIRDLQETRNMADLEKWEQSK
jgi:hypothetical protein